MQGEQFANCGPRPNHQALYCTESISWIPLGHLLVNQPPVTVRDTSIENLRNRGHTGRKPPSQPSNPAGHLAAHGACSAGHQRGTTQPQNPQLPQGAAGTTPWLPGPTPTPTSPYRRFSLTWGWVTKQEKGPERKSSSRGLSRGWWVALGWVA